MTLPSALEKSYSRWLHVSWLCPYSVCPIKTWHTLQPSSSRSSWKGWKVCPQRTAATWNPAAREKLAPSACSHSCSKFALFACSPKKSQAPFQQCFFWRVYYPSAVSDLKEAVYWASASKVLLCHKNGTNIIPWTHMKAWKWNHSSWNLGDEAPPNTVKLTQQRLLSGSSKSCTQHLFAQWCCR